MRSLNPYLEKAENSSFALWKLNQILWFSIPFNYPHRFKVIKVEKESLTIEMPYIRKNLNHIKGLHACGLATLCEYVCGLQLIKLAGNDEYRIILKSLNIQYHYQAKMKVTAHFALSQDWFQKEIEIPLKSSSSIVRSFPVEVYDDQNKLICTGVPEWQIKPWDKVKTRL